jgi:hypothetical protein
MKYFVISGTHDQFSEWRRRNGTELLLNRRIESLQDIVYVAGADTLKGIENPKGIFIGTWYTRSNITEILLQLSMSIIDIKNLDPINRAWEIIRGKRSN